MPQFGSKSPSICRSLTRTAVLLVLASGLHFTRQALADDPKPPEQPTSPWRDPVLIAKRLTEACDAVEKECGATFEHRPTAKLSTREEVKEIARRELAPILEAQGEKQLLDSAAEFFSRAAVGKYEPSTNVIHLLPENEYLISEALKEPSPPSEDELRVVLAHEATHALDFSRFPLLEARKSRTTDDGQKALGAVMEGHAQFVAERVAATWGISAAFERFARSITALPPIEDEAVRRVAATLATEWGFAYVQGLSFMRAVAAAKGREGVEAALRSPPPGGRWIEHPEDWVRGAASEDGGPDLDGAVGALRYLLGDPAWTTIASRVAEATLKVQGRSLTEEQRKNFLHGYVDGRFLIGKIPGEPRQAILFIALFAAESHAKAFIELEHETSALREAKGGAPIPSLERAEGAGSGRRLPGFTSRMVVKHGEEEFATDKQMLWIGRLAFEMILVNAPEIDRAAQDEAITRLEAFLKDPKAFAALPVPKPRPVVTKTRVVQILVTDAEGKPVPHAKASVSNDDGEQRVEVESGKAEVRAPRTALRLSVWAATDEKGEPLPLAPRAGVEVKQDDERVEVRLEAGTTIEGTTVDADGKAAAGAVVEAVPGGGPHFFHGPGDDDVVIHGRATSGPEGAFRIVGLGAEEYTLQMREGKDVVSSDGPTVRGGDRGVTVRRSRGGPATITVVDPENHPVQWAEVRLWAQHGHSRRLVVGARTDLSGHIRIPMAGSDATFKLEIDPPMARRDLAKTRLDEWKPTEAPIRLAKGYAITGVAVDEQGHPVKATVTWEVIRDREATSITTDDDGRFEFTGIPLGPTRIRAEEASDSPEMPFPPDEDETWVEVSPEKPEVSVKVVKHEPFVIRVVDTEGRPVREASATVATEHRSWEIEVKAGEGHTRAPKAPFSVAVFRAIAADGSFLGPLAKAGIAPGTASVEFRLRTAVEIAGRAIDGEGHGVSGVKVVAIPAEKGDFDDPLSWGLRSVGSEGHGSATTDADGRFRIVGLGRQAYRLRATPGEQYAEPPEKAAEGGATDVVLEFHRGTRTTVTVVDADGHPVSGARVWVQRLVRVSSSRTNYEMVVEASTDASGTVHVPPLGPGDTYELNVAPPEAREDLRSTLRKEWKPMDERVQLETAFSMSGVVLDEDGKPVAGAQVRAESESGASSDATSGTDGSFRVRGLAVGPVRLRAVPQGTDWHDEQEVPWTKFEAGTKEVTLRMPPRRRPLKIHVEGAGKRPGRLVVTGDSGQARIREFDLDAGGNAEVKSLPPGTVTVWIPSTEADDRVGYRSEVAIADGTISLALEKGLSIRIHLVLSTDSTLNDLAILGPLGEPMRAVETESGILEVRGLPPGRWTIKAKARAPSSWIRANIEAEAGTEVTVEPK